MPKSPLVTASYDELISFLQFFRHHGTPVIIGGWAVYFYNPYFGSVDIDVVGHSFRGTFEEIIERFERTHGYEFLEDQSGVEMRAMKPIIKKGKRIGEMEIDACSYERKAAARFHENESKNLPYSLCDRDKHRKAVELAKDCVCYCPSKALLTLFKVKARRDRSYDVATKGATMSPTKSAWLQSKIIKDGSDILALLDPKPRKSLIKGEVDYDELGRIAVEFKIRDFVIETIEQVLTDGKALGQYGREIPSSVVLRSIRKI